MLAACAFWLAAFVRLGHMPAMSREQLVLATLLVMVLIPFVGFLCGLYRMVIRYHTPWLPLRAGMASALSGAVIFAVGFLLGNAPLGNALGLGVVFALMLFAFLVSSRLVARWLLGSSLTWTGKKVAVYGAGAAGRQLVALLRRAPEVTVVLFIDDDFSLNGRMVEDLLVINPRDRGFARQLRAKKVEEILLAIPSLKPARRREVLNFLGELPYRLRSVPGVAEIVSGKGPAMSELRDISVEELLGREPAAPLPGLLESCVKGKVVLVTGGGGSIGAELCRQALALRPSRLIALDHSEHALYLLERDLRRMRPQAGAPPALDFVLGSVANPSVLCALLEGNRVDTVYHAAAYKHVPTVEDNPVEGLRNNVLGTWYAARAAARARVQHFVLISSDKAVRPTSVMGATKRMAELVIQASAAQHPGTVFTMVRFGNVLKSSGSVVPLFEEQIKRGGPITLTHPDVKRYFMTIEEAVQLVMQAGAMARGGEVFVLDMGESMRIRDLAVKMVHLSGRTVRDGENPRGDIAIDVVGLRPGEKLQEELLISGEATGTQHPRIWQVREDAADGPEFEAALQMLEKAVRDHPLSLDVRGILATWVAGFGAQRLAGAGGSVESALPGTLH